VRQRTRKSREPTAKGGRRGALPSNEANTNPVSQIFQSATTYIIGYVVFDKRERSVNSVGLRLKVLDEEVRDGLDWGT